MSAKILIVDDEPSARLALENLLFAEGYVLQFSDNGSDGLSQARAWQPDVILSDVMMPGMDGFELCRRIRADVDLGQVLIILMTALDDRQTKLRGLEAGADDFVTKPIDSVELRARLHTFTRLSHFRKLDEERIKLKETHRELLQAHEALRVSEEYFRTFVEQSVDGFMVSDEQGIVTEWNQALSRITGLRREEVLGMTIGDIQFQMAVPEKRTASNIKHLKQAMNEMRQNGQSPFFGRINEFEIQTGRGERKYIQQTSFPIRASQGYRIGAVVRDVSERKRMARELEAESVRHRILFEESPDGILVVDPQTGGFLEFNTAAHAQLGYSREEFAQLHIFDVEAQETAEETRAHIEDVVRNGRSDFETSQRTKRGELRNVHVTAQIVEILGQPVYFCTWRDVTEHRRAEEVRRASDERYHLLFQTMLQGVVFQGADGHIIQANPAAERILGLTLEQMQARTSVDSRWRAIREDGSDFPGEMHPAMVALQTGQVVCDVVMGVFNPTSGSYRWININAVPRFRDGETTPYQVYTTFEDITERKQVQDELERFFNMVPDMACVASTDGYFKKLNGEWERTLGFSREELLSRPLADFIHPEDRKATFNEIARQVGGEATIRFVNRYQTKDGSYRWLEWNATPSPDGILLFAAARDITERKQAEEQIRSAKAFLDMVVDMSPFAMWISNEEGTLIRTNRALRETINLTNDVILGKYNVLEDENLEMQGVMPLVKAVFEKHEPARFNIPWKASQAGGVDFRGGCDMYIDVSMFPILDAQNELTNVVCQWIDTTERKRVDEALRESEEKYRNVVERANDGIVIIQDERIQFINARLAEKLGAAVDEIIATPFADHVHPGELPRVMDRYRRRMMGEDVEPIYETVLITRNGEGVDSEINAGTVSYQGKPADLVFVRDITQRKQAEKALRESEQRFSAAFSSNAVALAITTPDGRWVEVNKAFCALLGYTREELIGRTSAELGIVDAKIRQEILDAEHSSGSTQNVEVAVRNRNGKVYTVLVSAEPISLDGVPHRITTNVDITERKQAEKELRESEKKYRDLINGMNDTVWVIGFDTKILDVNNAATTVLGYSREELLSMKIPAIDLTLTPEQIQGLASDMSRDEVQVFETWHTTKDGRKIPVEVSSSLVSYAGKTVIMSIARDITDRKRAEEEREKLATLVESSPNFTGLASLDGQVQYINHGGRMLVGLHNADVSHMKISEFVPSDSFPLAQVMDDVMQKGWWQGEFALKNFQTNAVLPVQLQAFTICQPQTHQPIALGTVMQDITERKRAEEEIQHRNEDLLLINALNDAVNRGEPLPRILEILAHEARGMFACQDVSVYLLSPDGKYAEMQSVTISPKLIERIERLIGRPVPRIQIPIREGGHLQGLLSSEQGTLMNDPQAIRQWIMEFVEIPSLPAIARPVIRKLISQIHEIVNIRSVFAIPLSSSGQVIGLMELSSRGQFTEDNLRRIRAISHQMTAIILRMRAEDQLRRTLADLQRSNADLERFAYVASHDLQEPLRMVTSFVQLLGIRYRGQLDADADEFIGYAVEGARRMQQLILDLLAYSRVGTCDAMLEPTDADLACRTALRDLELAITESRTIVVCDSLPTVLADRTQLTQVFENLVGNAIKFRGAEPLTVRVSAQRAGGEWVFAVADNGIGIAPEYFERIFVMFQRLHDREQYPGTGIGLAICKRIIERHGGRIWVESQPGQGARFCFTLQAVA